MKIFTNINARKNFFQNGSHQHISPQYVHWSVRRNSLHEKDCFASGLAIPGGDAIKQKAAVAANFCNFYIPPQCKHWSVCRNSLNEKDCFACGSAIPGEMLRIVHRAKPHKM